jgi:hemerythrin-like domain-containing protein
MNAPLGVVQQPRSELLDAVAYLEQALTSARGHAVWTEEIRDHLGRLRNDFLAHVRGAEGDSGLYRDIMRTSPRLAYRISRLSVEHDSISREIDEVLALARDVPDDRDSWVDRVYQSARALLRRLSRHRQREADLIYEAYETDIGGET